MAAEPVLLAVEEPKFCSLFCKVAASPLEVASVKEKGNVSSFGLDHIKVYLLKLYQM